MDETALVLKVSSPVGVMRDWSSAKAWLYRELTGRNGGGLVNVDRRSPPV